MESVIGYQIGSIRIRYIYTSFIQKQIGSISKIELIRCPNGKFKLLAIEFGLWRSKNRPTVLILRNLNNCATVWLSSLGSSNSYPTLLLLRSSNNWRLVLVLSFEKLQQLPNDFDPESLEVESTAKHLWSFEVQKMTNGFGLVSWEVQTTFRHFRCWKVQITAQHFWFWKVQTSDLQFCSWVMGSSNNCSTVLVSNLAKFNLLAIDFGVWRSKNCPTVLV